jgi:hypothetical protein
VVLERIFFSNDKMMLLILKVGNLIDLDNNETTTTWEVMVLLGIEFPSKEKGMKCFFIGILVLGVLKKNFQPQRLKV